jgi:hypothetical protein
MKTDTLGFTSLQASVLETNFRPRVINRCDFQLEGMLRSYERSGVLPSS